MSGAVHPAAVPQDVVVLCYAEVGEVRTEKFSDGAEGQEKVGGMKGFFDEEMSPRHRL